MQTEYNRLPLEEISQVVKEISKNRWYRHVFGDGEHIVRCPLGRDLVASEVFVDNLQHIEIRFKGNGSALLLGKALWNEGIYRMHMSWACRVPHTIERVVLHFNLYGMGCNDTFRVYQDSLDVDKLWKDLEWLDRNGRIVC